MDREKQPSWWGNLLNQWFPAAPSQPGALFVHARRLYDQGDFSGCVQQLTAALALPPDPGFVPARAFRWRGLAYRAMGKAARALADLEEVVRLKPESRSGYIDLADLHAAEEAWAEALAVLSRGIERVPARQTPPLYLQRGKMSHALQDYLAAVDDFNVAVYHLPRQSEGWRLRGLSRAALKEYRPAIRDCEKAVSLAPDDHRTHYALGRVLFRAGRYRAAARALQRAVELEPQQKASLSLLGRALVQLEDFERARSCLQAAIDLGAGDAATRDALHRALRGIPWNAEAPGAPAAETGLLLEMLEAVEEEPLFPGFNHDLPAYYEKRRASNAALQEFFGDHRRYPALARMMGREGIVWIALTVERDGRLTRPRVHHSISRELDQEALRLVQRMVDLGIHWIPAKRNGVPVPALCRLPVPFRLED